MLLPRYQPPSSSGLDHHRANLSARVSVTKDLVRGVKVMSAVLADGHALVRERRPI